MPKEGTLRVDKPLYSELGHPVTLEDWRKALLLPDSFRLVDINLVESGHPYYQLYAVSDAIPDNNCPERTVVIPIYFTEYVDGVRKNGLLRVHINQWDGTQWLAVKTIEVRERNDTT